ncbi:hypothetical protein ABZ753_25855 [Streptomyces griseoincarnatus]
MSVPNGRWILPVISRRGPSIKGLGELRYVVEQSFSLLHHFKRMAVCWERCLDLHDALVSSPPLIRAFIERLSLSMTIFCCTDQESTERSRHSCAATARGPKEGMYGQKGRRCVKAHWRGFRSGFSAVRD